ncbi:ribonucleoside-triphosphate reductase, adenosylcobalamin-dependent [Actinacidiphila glaucinigra]|uniref:Adenosylcobalamin-dependent ribonucleoside-triphosphate reductase n=1 Tax=Actinacidiphila glaucinigra TaxID=235986 RepID=A0A239F4D8_9ACTN|nr:ribonucleoside-triphosphate reductase, adenosylcobalamin-dependent [Actinacidiphila glaucinigra]SNS51113.1 ribonucleoside-triphosphate reductase [Actinacidiphila glaucinigra]
MTEPDPAHTPSKESTISTIAVPFGPTGQTVYERTYSRTKADGSREVWPETVRRVAAGNLGLVYGPAETWNADVKAEHDELVSLMDRFAIIPAGRHLWASGIRGRQYLFNCHVSGWGEKLSRHYEFSFMRLMEGGGVGANYSSRFLMPYGAPRRALTVHIVCDPSHPDFKDMAAAGILSDAYDSDWDGAFEVEDSREGWADALVDLIDTFMTDDEVKHSDRVYDVSRVRGKGARLKTFGGVASGPAPFGRMMQEIGRVLSEASGKQFCGFGFCSKALCGDCDRPRHLTPVEAMEIDHAIAECVVSGGNRRSARMAICHWADPYIEQFLSAKEDTSKHWTTNVSVEIDSDFTEYLSGRRDDEFGPGGTELARLVHRRVVEGMLRNGEPGYWNSTLTNVGEVGQVIATNPCGEIGLEAWENCNLGHINLDAFVVDGHQAYDESGLARAHELMTRFLIRATYGDVNDAEQAERLAANRRIGVGHLGVQGFLAKQGIRYSEAPAHTRFRMLLRSLARSVRKAAREYAFELRIPEPVKTTTVAPTGTVAKLPGVTEGIHPIYARTFLRRVRFSVADPHQAAKVEEFRAEGYDVEPCVYDASGNTMVVTFPTLDKLVEEVESLGYPADLVESADELSLDQLLAFQAMYQAEWADNAVSFTANVPEGLDVDDTMDVIEKWLPHLKGTTIMVDGTRPQAPYERISRAQFDGYALFRIEDSTDEDCASGACPIR